MVEMISYFCCFVKKTAKDKPRPFCLLSAGRKGGVVVDLFNFILLLTIRRAKRSNAVHKHWFTESKTVDTELVEDGFRPLPITGQK
jgi:hypothetical protein